MTTSGDLLQTVSGLEIITEALEMMGVLGEGELSTTDQQTSLLRTLNSMMIAWQANGLNLFAVQKTYLFLETLKEGYNLLTDHYVTKYLTTSTYDSSPSGSNVLVVTDLLSSDILANDPLGVYLTTGEMYWSTVASISGTSVSLTSSLPENVDEGATVYTYSSEWKAKRPMKTLEGYFVQENGTSIPMKHLPRQEYHELSRKDSVGSPLQWYYDPQVTAPTVYIWPTATNSRDVILLNVQRQVDEVNIIYQDVDLPAEWFLPLASNLAYIASSKHGVPQFDYYRIREQAKMYYEMAEGFDVEWGTSVHMIPDDRG